MAIRLYLLVLLSLMALSGCTEGTALDEQLPGTAGKRTEQDCRPTFLHVSQKPIEVWVGHWKIGFEAFLVGCSAELGRIEPLELEAVENHLKSLIQTKGMPTAAQSQDSSFRSRLVSEVNEVTGSDVSDVLLLTRYSIEHEPGVGSVPPSEEKDVRQFRWD